MNATYVSGWGGLHGISLGRLGLTQLKAADSTPANFREEVGASDFGGFSGFRELGGSQPSGSLAS